MCFVRRKKIKGNFRKKSKLPINIPAQGAPPPSIINNVWNEKPLRAKSRKGGNFTKWLKSMKRNGEKFIAKTRFGKRRMLLSKRELAHENAWKKLPENFQVTSSSNSENVDNECVSTVSKQTSQFFEDSPCSIPENWIRVDKFPRSRLTTKNDSGILSGISLCSNETFLKSSTSAQLLPPTKKSPSIIASSNFPNSNSYHLCLAPPESSVDFVCAQTDQLEPENEISKFRRECFIDAVRETHIDAMIGQKQCTSINENNFRNIFEDMSYAEEENFVLHSHVSPPQNENIPLFEIQTEFMKDSKKSEPDVFKNDYEQVQPINVHAIEEVISKEWLPNISCSIMHESRISCVKSWFDNEIDTEDSLKVSEKSVPNIEFKKQCSSKMIDEHRKCSSMKKKGGIDSNIDTTFISAPYSNTGLFGDADSGKCNATYEITCSLGPSNANDGVNNQCFESCLIKSRKKIYSNNERIKSSSSYPKIDVHWYPKLASYNGCPCHNFSSTPSIVNHIQEEVRKQEEGGILCNTITSIRKDGEIFLIQNAAHEENIGYDSDYKKRLVERKINTAHDYLSYVNSMKHIQLNEVPKSNGAVCNYKNFNESINTHSQVLNSYAFHDFSPWNVRKSEASHSNDASDNLSMKKSKHDDAVYSEEFQNQILARYDPLVPTSLGKTMELVKEAYKSYDIKSEMNLQYFLRDNDAIAKSSMNLQTNIIVDNVDGVTAQLCAPLILKLSRWKKRPHLIFTLLNEETTAFLMNIPISQTDFHYPKASTTFVQSTPIYSIPRPIRFAGMVLLLAICAPYLQRMPHLIFNLFPLGSFAIFPKVASNLGGVGTSWSFFKVIGTGEAKLRLIQPA